LVHDPAGELEAIVDHGTLGKASLRGEPLEHSNDSQAGERGVNLDRETLPRKVVHDVQGSENSAGGQRVGHEVHRPWLGPTQGRAWGIVVP
jgi:hypothetical protein